MNDLDSQVGFKNKWKFSLTFVLVLLGLITIIVIGFYSLLRNDANQISQVPSENETSLLTSNELLKNIDALVNTIVMVRTRVEPLLVCSDPEAPCDPEEQCCLDCFGMVMLATDENIEVRLSGSTNGIAFGCDTNIEECKVMCTPDTDLGEYLIKGVLTKPSYFYEIDVQSIVELKSSETNTAPAISDAFEPSELANDPGKFLNQVLWVKATAEEGPIACTTMACIGGSLCNSCGGSLLLGSTDLALTGSVNGEPVRCAGSAGSGSAIIDCNPEQDKEYYFKGHIELQGPFAGHSYYTFKVLEIVLVEDILWVNDINLGQCNRNPWNQDADSIAEFFAKKDITVLDVESFPREDAVCEACGCPDYEVSSILIDKKHKRDVQQIIYAFNEVQARLNHNLEESP